MAAGTTRDMNMQLLDICNRASRQCIGLVMGLVFGLAATTSHASSPQIRTFADGAAEVTFSFDLGSDFVLESLTLLLDFDTALMGVASSSPAKAFAGNVLLASSDAMLTLPDGAMTFLDFVQNDGLGASASLIAVPFTTVSGTLTVTLPFQLSGPAPAMVSFGGELAGNGGAVTLDAASFTVSPVPEPETLLLWLGGGALLAAAARRRTARA